METYKFSNFPIATVAFGINFRSTDYEILQEQLGELKRFAMSTASVLEAGKKYSKKLEKYAINAGKFASVMTVLVALVGEVDLLYKELKNQEQKIFNTILEGKLKALDRNLKNLQDCRTSEVQKVAEIVNAISNLDELLPVFEKDNSIFRERFYLGAPLFIKFCVILKSICLIAEHTTDYNTSNLEGLKEGYQKVLDWYRIKCIGCRMASCYVKGMLTLPSPVWTSDWERHYKLYKKYYEENTWFYWSKYAQNLGGGGWRLWCGWATYCVLIDTWDNREHDKVKFEAFEIKNTNSYEYKGEVKYHQDVLAEYRKRVEKVMLGFFSDVSLIS